MKTLGKLALLVVSAVAFYFSVLWLFKSEHLAVIITASVALHEVGHAVALWLYGQRVVSMFFVPFLGAAVSMDKPPKEHNQYQMAVVALAGPAMNVLLIAGSIFFLDSDVWGTDALAIMSVNASLAIYNLVPLGFLDGGRFVKAVFHSTDEEMDKLISTLVSVLAFLIGFSLIFIGGKFNFIYILVYYGISTESRKDDPMGYLSDAAMTLQQVKRLMIVYVIMLVATWLLNYYLPSWSHLY